MHRRRGACGGRPGPAGQSSSAEREKISGEAQRTTWWWSDRFGDPLAELGLRAYLLRATEEALRGHIDAIKGLVHERAVPVELLERPAGIGICAGRG